MGHAPGTGLENSLWTTTNPTLLDEMLTGGAGELGFALVPRLATDDQAIEVSTDFVELVLSYRYP